MWRITGSLPSKQLAPACRCSQQRYVLGCTTAVTTSLPPTSWPPPAGALSSALPYGPAVADHCLLIAGLAPLQKVQGQPLSSSQKAALQKALRDWELWLDRCEP